ncbi:MAG TPA: glycoside hydrolase family 36 protein [Candidatus Limnocylindrales bacterium]|nr:glycoside hydrolase family 36 protein [Candidatus Limnocylindrales bacterium]
MTRAGSRLAPSVPAPLDTVARLPADLVTARVFEHGWQSWTPTTTYGIGETPIRPRDERLHRPGAQPGTRGAAGRFQGEGLLAVQPAGGAPVHVFAANSPLAAPVSITAALEGASITVRATDRVYHLVDEGTGGLDGALARWADGFADRAGIGSIPRPPTAWCSWYHYFTDVTAADIEENLRAIETLALPVDVVQVDDGWQAGIGDWTTFAPGFATFPDLVARIRRAGRRAGAWIAPFLVGARSATAIRHPDWLVADASGPITVGRNWDQDLFALDTTHPAASASLRDALEMLRGLGVSYVKADFVWAGAVPGRRHEPVQPLDAYRIGIEIVRDAIGDAYLLGCGAPVLPSVGLFDAMRVGPDTAPHWEPRSGDLSEPGARSAMVTSAGRAFMHGRFWVNDADCLLARPGVERREAWAVHVAACSGLRASSDRIRDLDDWGLRVTRAVLGTPAPPLLIPSA